MTAHAQKDHDVIAATHQLLTQLQEPLVLDDFNLWECRADIVSIHDDYMNGYELKSESDNLLRPPKQVNDYSEICKYSTLIVADTHAMEAISIIPDSWGLIIAHDDDVTSPEKKRDPQPSPILNAHQIASLLWRDEESQFMSHDLGMNVALRGIRYRHVIICIHAVLVMYRYFMDSLVCMAKKILSISSSTSSMLYAGAHLMEGNLADSTSFEVMDTDDGTPLSVSCRYFMALFMNASTAVVSYPSCRNGMVRRSRFMVPSLLRLYKDTVSPSMSFTNGLHRLDCTDNSGMNPMSVGKVSRWAISRMTTSSGMLPCRTCFHMFCKDMQEVRIILTVAYPTMMQCRRDAE